jgi:hypothetical protein
MRDARCEMKGMATNRNSRRQRSELKPERRTSDTEWRAGREQMSEVYSDRRYVHSGRDRNRMTASERREGKEGKEGKEEREQKGRKGRIAA